MKVFGFYDGSPDADPRQSGLIRIWDKSWTEHGWTTRLLTAQHAEKCVLWTPKRKREDYPLLALHRIGGGWLSPFELINLGFTTDRFRGKQNFQVTPTTVRLLVSMSRNAIESYMKTGKFNLRELKAPEGTLAYATDEEQALKLLK